MNKDLGKLLDPVLNTIKKVEVRFSNLFSRFRNKKITVQTEVKGVEKVEQAKQKIETLPKTKNVKMKVEKSGDFSALEMTGKNLEKNISVKSKVSGLDQVQQLGTAVNKLPKTITVTPPPVGPWSKMNGIFQSLRSGFNNFGAGLKNVSEVFISSGGGAMVLIEGFKSLINIGKHFYGEWINGMKEAAAMSEQNAAGIREAAQANEELRQKGDSYLAQLEQIASQESLSNANKADAKKAIDELTKAYGDLGVKLDETTGKLTGVDSAMIKKAEKDKSRRLKELDAELKELQNANQQQAELRDKAGVPVWFGGNIRIGGKETSEAAAKQIAENNKRIAENMRQRKRLTDSDPAGELRAKRQAEAARQEEEYKRRQRAFEDRKHDDAFAAETDPAKKIANRQFMLDRHNREVLDPLRKKIAAAEERVKNTTGDDRTEAQRILTQLKSEELSAKEKSYGWEKQIKDIIHRTEINRPSKPVTPVQTQGPDKTEKNRPSKPVTPVRIKGPDKTVKETVRQESGPPSDAADIIPKLFESIKVPYLTDRMPFNLPERTHDLIDRSGFSGAAVVPDADKYNRQIAAENKAIHSILQRIESMVNEFGKF